MSDKTLRKQLVGFLKGGETHMPFSDAIKNFSEKHINDFFPNGDYTFWHLLEHIRFTQKDILDFMIDPKYKEPEWPKDYWPEKTAKATKKDWEKTITDYQKDVETLIALVQNPKIDLYAKVPKGTGQIYLREFIMVSDHTSYHMGEFAIMRQVLKLW